jgi:hypothetical protein
VNIPTLVYADLTGSPRPAPTRLKAGLRWCHPWQDFAAARAAGEPLLAWARWTFSAQAKSALWFDDPLPLLHATLPVLARRHGTRDVTGVWQAPKGKTRPNS